MINNFKFIDCSKKYKNLQKQIFKIKEEVDELYAEYLNSKYLDDKLLHKINIGNETLDIMQSCATLLNCNFDDEEIKQLEKINNFKLKRRLDI